MACVLSSTAVLLSSCLRCLMVAVLWLYQWPQHRTGHRKGKYEMSAGICYCLYSNHGKKHFSSSRSGSLPELWSPNSCILTQNNEHLFFFHCRRCIYSNVVRVHTHLVPSHFIWDTCVGMHCSLKKWKNNATSFPVISAISEVDSLPLLTRYPCYNRTAFSPRQLSGEHYSVEGEADL